MYAVLLLVLPCGSHGDVTHHGRELLPSQHPHRYRWGCTPANRHCERCRHDGCGGHCYDFRRNFDYPWYPPYHRPVLEDTPYDVGPRIIPLSELPPGELPLGGAWCPEEVLPPRRPGLDESSPSDRPPRGKSPELK